MLSRREAPKAQRVPPVQRVPRDLLAQRVQLEERGPLELLALQVPRVQLELLELLAPMVLTTLQLPEAQMAICRGECTPTPHQQESGRRSWASRCWLFLHRSPLSPTSLTAVSSALVSRHPEAVEHPVHAALTPAAEEVIQPVAAEPSVSSGYHVLS